MHHNKADHSPGVETEVNEGWPPVERPSFIEETRDTVERMHPKKVTSRLELWARTIPW